ncbi:hypothetical protein [Nitrosopumilus spindle-shaped virus]|uniref:Uncharacterized protein n=1 Tax=Nitrosopumilus spindle-shaped virus TaxID=2508184 RepID=A0A514K390_9VIRU|nr:hypothetical protein [Nitrosopumilus spindle-shaped virus]
MNKILKHSLLYFCCVFVPIVPYVYAKKKLRGLIVEGSAFGLVLLGSNLMAFALSVTIDASAPPQTINVDDLLLQFYFGLGVVITAGLGTIADSFYVLYKKLKSETKTAV